MNEKELMKTLARIRARSTDDYAKCRQAIDAVSTLVKTRSQISLSRELKIMLLAQLDDLYSRAMRQLGFPKAEDN